MSKEKDINQWIDDYIFGTLSEQEHQLFQKRLEAEPELAEQVKIQQALKSGVEAFGRKTLKTELQGMHEEVVGLQPEPAKRRSLRSMLIAAASFLLLISAMLWLFAGPGDDQEGLYATYFKAYDLSTTQRSKANEALINIEQLYQDEKYAVALPLIQAHVDSLSPAPSSWLLAAGICQLELDRPQEALQFFQKISAQQDFNFRDEVSWFSALAYLKAGELDKTKKALEALVVDERADHHEEALDLLEALE